jgi:CRISPR-associated endonuclease/helicase Cas3
VDNEPLAHSAHDGADSQTYLEHIDNVVGNEKVKGAVSRAEAVAAFSPKWCAALVAVVRAAAAYHDLGKLDDFFQNILRHNRRNSKGFNHCDAGTAFLLRERFLEAAILVYSHHVGFPNMQAERAKNANDKNNLLRDESPFKEQEHYRHTDAHLDAYLQKHDRIFPKHQLALLEKPPIFNRSNLTRRIALSCLVDADHSDTARHYKKETDIANATPALLPAKRLDALDAYVAGLAPCKEPADDRERERLRLRQDIYATCRDALPDDATRIVSCDSPVGTGKTTAVMAHLLRVAAKRDLRRIFVVLPFTNIIDQSVETYRKALVLPGEDPETIVAAHHHRVEFSGENHEILRLLTQRWEAPIVVTTAVRFFETLAAKDTATLRNFHQIPGSAVFIDETHAAMPVPLWPQMWRWITELCDDWTCHFVLASGSLARFWTLPNLVIPAEQREIPRLVAEEKAAPSFDYEKNRVSIKTLQGEKGSLLSRDELAKAVLAASGPRLVIFNTVQSAAAFAHYLRDEKGGNLGPDIEHLSTALSPADRNKTLKRVRKRLRAGEKNWVLVATSCVEAGVDFSFRTGFRERSSFASLLQVLGRVSRNGEYNDAVVWDFQHDASESDLLSIHPHFKTSARVVGQLLEKYGTALAPEHCTEALQLEINQGTGDTEKMIREIRAAENANNFPEVAKLCRLITSETQTVVVSQALIERLESGKKERFPSSREMMLNSVQIWENKLADLSVKPIGFGRELLGISEGNYDDFLGYMKGLLPVLKGKNRGGWAV